MTKLTNVTIPEKYVLDPCLAKAVYKLALDKPDWMFTLKAKDLSKYHCTSASPIQGDREDYIPEGDEDTRFLRFVEVYDNKAAACMGGIGVEYHYSRGTDQRYKYYIKSWRIESRRGDKKSSVKLDTIVREAKRTFKSKGLKELMNDGKEKIRNGFWHAIQECIRPVGNGRLLKSLVDLQLYGFCIANQRDVDTSKFQQLLDTLRSPQFEEGIAKYELGEYMQSLKDAGKMNDVVVHEGEYLVQQSDNEDAEIFALVFEEMPQAWQERIAVLQLLKDNELVRDIGYRHDAETYRILA